MNKSVQIVEMSRFMDKVKGPEYIALLPPFLIAVGLRANPSLWLVG